MHSRRRGSSYPARMAAGCQPDPTSEFEQLPHFTFSKVTWRRSPERTEGPGHISVPVVLLCVCNNYSALSMNGINEDPVFGREVVKLPGREVV